MRLLQPEKGAAASLPPLARRSLCVEPDRQAHRASCRVCAQRRALFLVASIMWGNVHEAKLCREIACILFFRIVLYPPDQRIPTGHPGTLSIVLYSVLSSRTCCDVAVHAIGRHRLTPVSTVLCEAATIGHQYRRSPLGQCTKRFCGAMQRVRLVFGCYMGIASVVPANQALDRSALWERAEDHLSCL